MNILYNGVKLPFYFFKSNKIKNRFVKKYLVFKIVSFLLIQRFYIVKAFAFSRLVFKYHYFYYKRFLLKIKYFFYYFIFLRKRLLSRISFIFRITHLRLVEYKFSLFSYFWLLFCWIYLLYISVQRTVQRTKTLIWMYSKISFFRQQRLKFFLLKKIPYYLLNFKKKRKIFHYFRSYFYKDKPMFFGNQFWYNFHYQKLYYALRSLWYLIIGKPKVRRKKRVESFYAIKLKERCALKIMFGFKTTKDFYKYVSFLFRKYKTYFNFNFVLQNHPFFFFIVRKGFIAPYYLINSNMQFYNYKYKLNSQDVNFLDFVTFLVGDKFQLSRSMTNFFELVEQEEMFHFFFFCYIYITLFILSKKIMLSKNFKLFFRKNFKLADSLNLLQDLFYFNKYNPEKRTRIKKLVSSFKNCKNEFILDKMKLDFKITGSSLFYFWLFIYYAELYNFNVNYNLETCITFNFISSFIYSLGSSFLYFLFKIFPYQNNLFLYKFIFIVLKNSNLLIFYKKHYLFYYSFFFNKVLNFSYNPFFYFNFYWKLSKLSYKISYFFFYNFNSYWFFYKKTNILNIFLSNFFYVFNYIFYSSFFIKKLKYFNLSFLMNTIRRIRRKWNKDLFNYHLLFLPNLNLELLNLESKIFNKFYFRFSPYKYINLNNLKFNKRFKRKFIFKLQLNLNFPKNVLLKEHKYNILSNSHYFYIYSYFINLFHIKDYFVINFKHFTNEFITLLNIQGDSFFKFKSRNYYIYTKSNLIDSIFGFYLIHKLKNKFLFYKNKLYCFLSSIETKFKSNLFVNFLNYINLYYLFLIFFKKLMVIQLKYRIYYKFINVFVNLFINYYFMNDTYIFVISRFLFLIFSYIYININKVMNNFSLFKVFFNFISCLKFNSSNIPLFYFLLKSFYFYNSLNIKDLLFIKYLQLKNINVKKSIKKKFILYGVKQQINYFNQLTYSKFNSLFFFYSFSYILFFKKLFYAVKFLNFNNKFIFFKSFNLLHFLNYYYYKSNLTNLYIKKLYNDFIYNRIIKVKNNLIRDNENKKKDIEKIKNNKINFIEIEQDSYLRKLIGKFKKRIGYFYIYYVNKSYDFLCFFLKDILRDEQHKIRKKFNVWDQYINRNLVKELKKFKIIPFLKSELFQTQFSLKINKKIFNLKYVLNKYYNLLKKNEKLRFLFFKNFKKLKKRINTFYFFYKTNNLRLRLKNLFFNYRKLNFYILWSFLKLLRYWKNRKLKFSLLCKLLLKITLFRFIVFKDKFFKFKKLIKIVKKKFKILFFNYRSFFFFNFSFLQEFVPFSLKNVNALHFIIKNISYFYYYLLFFSSGFTSIYSLKLFMLFISLISFFVSFFFFSYYRHYLIYSIVVNKNYFPFLFYFLNSRYIIKLFFFLKYKLLKFPLLEQMSRFFFFERKERYIRILKRQFFLSSIFNLNIVLLFKNYYIQEFKINRPSLFLEPFTFFFHDFSRIFFKLRSFFFFNTSFFYFIKFENQLYFYLYKEHIFNKLYLSYLFHYLSVEFPMISSFNFYKGINLHMFYKKYI